MAAENMQDIKRRIKSVTSTEHITNAMSWCRRASSEKQRPYSRRRTSTRHYITHTIAEIFRSNKEIPQEYLAGNRR